MPCAKWQYINGFAIKMDSSMSCLYIFERLFVKQFVLYKSTIKINGKKGNEKVSPKNWSKKLVMIKG